MTVTRTQLLNIVSELCTNKQIGDAYLNAMVCDTLRAAGEALQHDTEEGQEVADEQVVHRLARAQCFIHSALNNSAKYADGYGGVTRHALRRMHDAYYKMRYAHEDNLPGRVDAPKW